MESSFEKAVRILQAVAFVAVLAVTAAAQSEQFVSVYGNFSIDLPKITTVTKGFRDDESKVKSAGMVYAWDTGKVVYTVRYSVVSGISKAKPEPGSRLEAENKAVTETVTQYKGEIASKESVSVSGSTGTEIKARIGAGQLIARNAVVGGRAYSIQAIARDAEDFDEAVKRLDSFTIVDGEKILNERIAAMRPEPFNRTSKRAYSPDAKSENLRGPVKSVAVAEEDLSGEGPQQGVVESGRISLNKRGEKVEEVLFDRSGNPSDLNVFGFENGARVFKTVGPREPGAATMRTLRSRFDRRGRALKTETYNEGGSLLSSRTVVYSRNKITSTLTGSGVTFRSVSKTDGADNPIQTYLRMISPKKDPVVFRFHYLQFDRRGNWTKRIRYNLSENEGRKRWEPVTLQTRTIIYFKKLR